MLIVHGAVGIQPGSERRTHNCDIPNRHLARREVHIDPPTFSAGIVITGSRLPSSLMASFSIRMFACDT